MSTAAKIGLALALVGFVAFVIYSSLDLNQFTCEICMDYNGLTNCGTASGTTEMEARSTAITVACANISSGVTDSMACSNTPPKSVDCRKN